MYVYICIYILTIKFDRSTKTASLKVRLCCVCVHSTYSNCRNAISPQFELVSCYYQVCNRNVCFIAGRHNNRWIWKKSVTPFAEYLHVSECSTAKKTRNTLNTQWSDNPDAGGKQDACKSIFRRFRFDLANYKTQSNPTARQQST